nr:sulfotransferase family 2 domain-containing protein [Gymnodinialimonas phycosphaerae]
MRLAYDPKHKFFFARIPKAGNSTVVSTLIRHIDPTASAASMAADKQRLNRLPTKRQFDAAFKFTVVRDPTDRVISGYLDKVARDADGFGPDAFGAFLQELRDGDYRKNGHFIPQTAMIPGGLGAMDHVGRIETLDADLEVICTRLFGGFTARTDRVAHRTGAATNRAALLTPENTDLISALYRQDFEALGYPAPIPFDGAN